ncbi:MAG: (Fe-S)-binding protein [Thermodesulfobacteriota bacterium]
MDKDSLPSNWKNKGLHDEQQKHGSDCVDCGACSRGCMFLQKVGSPGEIARNLKEEELLISFECSLCGLCEAVCPPKIGLNPSALFFEMRREAVLRNLAPLPAHRPLLGYEKQGKSKWFTCQGLPDGCDTVFFPGCALPATRSELVLTLYDHLLEINPAMGIVLDCCTKPSHDLGCSDDFSSRFEGLLQMLIKRGVTTVLTACPSCYKVFKEYGDGLKTVSIYELLAGAGRNPVKAEGTVTVHDSCSTRFETSLQQAVRSLIGSIGLNIEEMKHQGDKTICCGEGGAVSMVNHELAENWGEKRAGETSHFVVTYCAGCTNYLGKRMDVGHVLDLYFSPAEVLAGKMKLTRAPWTYLKRLLLKHRLKNG